MSNELEDDRLVSLENHALAADGECCDVSALELLELVRAYRYHKSVMPLHQAINEACKKLGY